MVGLEHGGGESGGGVAGNAESSARSRNES